MALPADILNAEQALWTWHAASLAADVWERQYTALSWEKGTEVNGNEYVERCREEAGRPEERRSHGRKKRLLRDGVPVI
jgi:hypothetical protein